MQPVAAAYNDKLYVWGGFYADGEQSKVHTDGYVYDVNAKEWGALSAPRSADGEEMTLCLRDELDMAEAHKEKCQATKRSPCSRFKLG